ncbi:MAG: MATE family efflux transporter, partial [Pseudomonadota bacterium]
ARNLCEADGRTGVMLWAQAIGLVINLIADLGLGLGWFGMPKLGLAGIGWATTAVQWSMAIVLIVWIAGPRMARYAVFDTFSKPNAKALRDLLALSIPIWLALLFEAGLFSATAVQAGVLGVLPMGAHNIAIGATSFAYMLPLGLSLALTARIGRVHGRGNLAAVRLRVVSGVLLTVALAGCTALILWVFRHPIAALYTPDPALRALAAQLLLLAAVFQLSDGMQATMFGILRGLHDTRAPMLINAFSYWCIAFGLGYWLAHSVGLGVSGLWYGLIIGLTISSILLGLRVRWRIKHYDRLR